MKDIHKKIEEEVARTMASLDHIDRLEGNPWLYTRIRERLDTAPSKTVPCLVWRLQPVVMAVLLILNTWMAYSIFSDAPAEETFLETIAEEYTYNANDLMDYYFEE